MVLNQFCVGFLLVLCDIMIFILIRYFNHELLDINNDINNINNRILQNNTSPKILIIYNINLSDTVYRKSLGGENFCGFRGFMDNRETFTHNNF